jgi:hypothetical protein
MTKHNADHRSAPAFVLFVLFVVSFVSGCAIVPRGPIVSRSHEEFRGRADGLISRDVWRDDAFSRGVYFFSDPSLQMICAWHTNQTALGGGSRFMAGTFGITVDTNLTPAIAAGGTAVGNIVGATVKTIAK